MCLYICVHLWGGEKRKEERKEGGQMGRQGGSKQVKGSIKRREEGENVDSLQISVGNSVCVA